MNVANIPNRDYNFPPNVCFRIYESLFGKKEEKRVEEKVKVETKEEPPKKEFKCKCVTHFSFLLFY